MKIIIPVSTHHGNNNRHVIFCRRTRFSRRHRFGTIAINCRDDWLWITGKIAPRLWGGWKLPTWRITGRVCAGRRGNSRSPQPETPTHGRQTTPHTAPSRLTNSLWSIASRSPLTLWLPPKPSIRAARLWLPPSTPRHRRFTTSLRLYTY